MIELFRMFVIKIILVQQAIINVENWIEENNQAGIKMDSVFLSHLEKGIQLKKWSSYKNRSRSNGGLSIFYLGGKWIDCRHLKCRLFGHASNK